MLMGLAYLLDEMGTACYTTQHREFASGFREWVDACMGVVGVENGDGAIVLQKSCELSIVLRDCVTAL